MSAAPRWVVDASRDPIVCLRVEGGDGGETAPDFQTFLQAIDTIEARHGPMAIVFDLTDAKPDAVRRRKGLERLRERETTMRHKIRCVSIVAPTAFARGIMQAALWFHKPRIPVKAFGTHGEANKWARDQLSERGVR